MKKTFVLTLLSSLIACNNEDVPSVDNIQDNVKISSIRSLEEAKQIALDATNMLNPNKARSAYRTLDLGNIKIITKASSRNTESVNDTLMYIINYEDNAGFAVISANPNTEALLAVTEQGSYNSTNNENKNGGFAIFMERAEKYVSTYSIPELPNPGVGLKEYKMVSDTTTVEVNPLINAQWGQEGPEAAYTPNGATGCMITAMAQIMSYYKYPTLLNITYPGATKTTQTLNWVNMEQHDYIKDIIGTCTANNDAHEAIGQLHRQLGHLTNSTYKDSGATSTTHADAISAFTTLGYNAPNFTTYSTAIYDRLIENKPVIVTGQDNASSKKLHAWIVDGYFEQKIVVTEWTKDMYAFEWELLTEYPPKYTRHLHINWGWSGECNGYFLAGVYAPGEGLEYDNPTIWDNSDNHNYANDMKYTAISR